MYRQECYVLIESLDSTDDVQTLSKYKTVKIPCVASTCNQALDLQLSGRRFDSQLFHQVTTLGKLFTHMSLHQAV